MYSEVHSMLNDGIIHSCNNANCTHPIYTGKCLDECWRRFRGEKKAEESSAYGDPRVYQHDFLLVECSNCGKEMRVRIE